MGEPLKMEGKSVNWLLNSHYEKDRGRKCPILNNPMPDCYCQKMNNENMHLALRFCINNYNACNKYKRIRENKKLGL